MDNNEKRISEYIDKLNKEQKPNEHGNPAASSELEKIFDTVRKIRSLKEPDMPSANYPKHLAHNVKRKLYTKNSTKKRKHIWLSSFASVAAVLIIAIAVNFTLPSDGQNIVYAMEEAYHEVRAYHGILEIVETNAEGKQNTQAKLEVWLDKEGHYYIKGLEGTQKNLITVNNGQKKWQIRPDQNQVHIFPAFPDAYRFVFELGNEIEDVKNAVSTKLIGEDVIAGRKTSILEVFPQGGVPYRIWIDKETKLPLQKQYEMQKAIQYTTTYTQIDFSEAIPSELIAYEIPQGFEEIDLNAEQIVNSLEEMQESIGFAPSVAKNIPSGYKLDYMAIVPDKKIAKLYYTAEDEGTKVIVIQGKSGKELRPAPTAVLGKINGGIAEIQSPMHEESGILGGGGLYSGVTDISSIRWQESDFEYAVIGNTALKELVSFTESVTNKTLEVPSPALEPSAKPQIEVPVDLEVEQNDQKSVDAGSSPWKLDPAFVAQVFVSLKISPEGVIGEYPVKYEDLDVIQNTGTEAVIEVNGNETSIKRVYLKRLIRQDATGIWTVVGYDTVE